MREGGKVLGGNQLVETPKMHYQDEPNRRMQDFRCLDVPRSEDRSYGKRTATSQHHRRQRSRHLRDGAQTERHRFHVANSVECSQPIALGSLDRMGRRHIPRPLHRRLEHHRAHRRFRARLHGSRDRAAQRDEHDAVGRSDCRRFLQKEVSAKVLSARRQNPVLDQTKS